MNRVDPNHYGSELRRWLATTPRLRSGSSVLGRGGRSWSETELVVTREGGRTLLVLVAIKQDLLARQRGATLATDQEERDPIKARKQIRRFLVDGKNTMGPKEAGSWATHFKYFPTLVPKGLGLKHLSRVQDLNLRQPAELPDCSTARQVGERC